MPSDRKPTLTAKQRAAPPAFLDGLISSKQLACEFNIREMRLRRYLRERWRKRDRTYWLFTPAEAEEVRKYVRTCLGRDEP